MPAQSREEQDHGDDDHQPDDWSSANTVRRHERLGLTREAMATHGAPPEDIDQIIKAAGGLPPGTGQELLQRFLNEAAHEWAVEQRDRKRHEHHAQGAASKHRGRCVRRPGAAQREMTWRGRQH